MTMLIVTHEMGFAREVADRVVFMDEGRVVEVGRSEQIFTQPRSPRLQKFLRAVIERVVMDEALGDEGSPASREPGAPRTSPDQSKR